MVKIIYLGPIAYVLLCEVLELDLLAGLGCRLVLCGFLNLIKDKWE